MNYLICSFQKVINLFVSIVTTGIMLLVTLGGYFLCNSSSLTQNRTLYGTISDFKEIRLA